MKTFIFFSSIISIILTSVLQGFVFQKLWSWFIVPFFNLPLIGIAQSLGLMLIVGMLTSSTKKDSEDDDSYVETLIKSTLKIVFMSVFYLVFGFIVQSFI